MVYLGEALFIKFTWVVWPHSLPILLKKRIVLMALHCIQAGIVCSRASPTDQYWLFFFDLSILTYCFICGFSRLAGVASLIQFLMNFFKDKQWKTKMIVAYIFKVQETFSFRSESFDKIYAKISVAVRIIPERLDTFWLTIHYSLIFHYTEISHMC